MRAQIHSTAIVEPGAKIADDVVIGAYAYIGKTVVLGEGTIVHHHASVEGNTVLGSHNEVFPYAYLGVKTHDLKYKGGAPGLIIGDYNVFREYSTVHCATNDGEFTILGSHCVVLAYSHVAHDCEIGDYMIMSSHAALGGHVMVGNHVNIGWGVGVHQFCRIGDHALLGAGSKVVQDVPPLMLADGNPAEVRTINKVGLERAGFARKDLELAKELYRILYRRGLNRTQAMVEIKQLAKGVNGWSEAVADFCKASKRGLA